MLIFTMNRKAFNVVSIFFNNLTRELLEDYRYKFDYIVPQIPDSLLKFNFILKRAKFKITNPLENEDLSEMTNPQEYTTHSKIVVQLGSIREDINAIVIADVFSWLEQVNFEQIQYICSYIKDPRVQDIEVYEALKLFYFEITNPF